ncbi:hypothetical protein B0F90DRAFT_1924981 [Multifurca ochricompacta]|uniref:Uncharacterized protein n=1 Tax=Multifurca ochricompacta TaxID=376703 RepID=A0AAD4M684_9AGAM|nr:hypothetical protein B0F90DRAFT_1924981 [Multifurca ochricompacta]
MSSLLTNYSFLSPLKRQRAVRNRAAAVPTPSNRFSRYGRDEFSFLDGFHLDRDFLTAAPRAAPNPPSSSANSIPQSVRLSAFDILIDAGASEPASPTFETPVATSTPPPTRPCDLRLQSPPRSRSPTPSLTSMSACSSNTDIPTTPFTSDDEWPGLQIPQKAISPPRVLIRPLVIVKSTPSILCRDINTADTFEFTLAPFSSPLGLEDEEQEVVVVDEAEDDMSWYARDLPQRHTPSTISRVELKFGPAIRPQPDEQAPSRSPALAWTKFSVRPNLSSV